MWYIILIIIVALGVGLYIMNRPKSSGSGKTVTIEGIARDAKAGAVVVNADNEPIFIDGLESWPAEFSGKQVRVSGVLVQKQNFPSATVDSNGAISQGTEGEQLESVLTNAKWELK